MNVLMFLAGAIPAVMVLSPVLAALVSVVLLRLYRRAVTRAMFDTTNVQLPPPLPIPTANVPQNSHEPVLEVVDSTLPVESAKPGTAMYREATRSLNGLAWAYVAAGLAYDLIFSAAQMLMDKRGFESLLFLWFAICYLWPAVFAACLANPLVRLRLVIGYFLLVAAIAVVALTRKANLTIGQLAAFWLLLNGPATLLLLAFLQRRVRAVGPLVLAIVSAAVTGALISVNLIGSSTGLTRAIVGLRGALGFGDTGTWIGLRVLGALAFALAGWMLLCWLGRRYEAKRTSSQSITFDALWLLFVVDHTCELAFGGGVWVLTGVVAFAAYKLIVRIGFGFLRPVNRDEPPGPTLLLLRVFSLAKRSEPFFDDLSRIWLRRGSINLLVGPDLVTSTIQPHEFLSFVGGRLSRQFVSGEPDLRRRLSMLDVLPDPDGNHRVNEFFCRADTWQMTMRALVEHSHTVLMDLRGFSKSNHGCIYELRQLCQCIELDRVILVIDAGTDRGFLEETVRGIWRQLDPGSPNASLDPPVIRCFALHRHGIKEIERLLGMLFGTKPAPAGMTEVAGQLAAG